jgi:hypothetical protein
MAETSWALAERLFMVSFEGGQKYGAAVCQKYVGRFQKYFRSVSGGRREGLENAS